MNSNERNKKKISKNRESRRKEKSLKQSISKRKPQGIRNATSFCKKTPSLLRNRNANVKKLIKKCKLRSSMKTECPYKEALSPEMPPLLKTLS
jgi:hypothetical protein